MLSAAGGLYPRFAGRVGPTDMSTALALLRILVGLVFVVAGAAKLIAHGPMTAQFAAWGLPFAGWMVVAVAATELVCGGLLVAGALTRPVALVLATLMVGAMLTAGRIDGRIHLILPPILFAICVFFAWRSGRYPGRTPLRRPGVQ
jgi:hypothetical protein